MSATALAGTGDVLHLYNWSGSLSQKILDDFQRQCACRVVQDFYGDNEEMLAKLASGARGYDMVFPSSFVIQAMARQHLLLPLDHGKLPNLRNVAPAYLNQSYDPGNTYTVPTVLSLTSVGYNVEVLKKRGVDAGSWAVIFDPAVLAKIKGKVIVLDSQRELMAAALMYLGKSANSADPKDWAAARNVILKAKPYWAAFNNQSYIKELTVGNMWVALGYSNDLYQAEQDALKARRPFKIGFGLQKEGNTMSIDNFVVLKDAPRKDLAYKFINFMLEGKNGAELSNEMGTGSPNQAAMAYVKKDLAKTAAIFPDKASLGRLQQLKDLNTKQRRDLNRMWSEIKLK